MLSFFPHPYPDELMYSVLARYHKRTGNNAAIQTIKELFGSRSITANINFITNLDAIIKNLPLGAKYTAEKFIYNNTLFSLYSPFMNKENHTLLLSLFTQGNQNYKKRRLGSFGNTFYNPKYLRFCPKCVQEDYEQYGELYWHRQHQILKTFVCAKHKVLIRNSLVRIPRFSTQNYIAATKENCFFYSIDEPIQMPAFEMLYRISKEVEWLLNHKTTPKSHNWVKDNIKSILAEKGYVTTAGIIRQHKLHHDFVEYFGIDFLDLTESSINASTKESWLREILSKQSDPFHPIRYILVCIFLGKSINQVINENCVTVPFGNCHRPYLKTTADHYLKPKMRNIVISKKYGCVIGKIKCTCDFIFNQEGTDENSEGNLRSKNMNDYEYIIKGKIRQLIEQKKLSIKQVSEILELSVEIINQILLAQESFKNLDKLSSICKKHRDIWINVQKEYPEFSRWQLAKKCPSTYKWLYTNDYKWFDANSPKKASSGGTYHCKKVDWVSKDEEVLERVKTAVYRLQNIEGKPVRITVAEIQRQINSLVIKDYLYKMPKTQAYLQKVVETNETYYIRKARWAAEFLYQNGEKLTVPKIKEKTCLYGRNVSKIVTEEMEMLVKNYSILNSNDQVAVSQESD